MCASEGGVFKYIEMLSVWFLFDIISNSKSAQLRLDTRLLELLGSGDSVKMHGTKGRLML